MRTELPRLPLDGKLDLTYRCNNRCRHCWLWVHPAAAESRDELSIDEIERIVDEARGMGCQAWGISGGEPMLRPDFPEIFDYITRKAVHYSLNTNGALITPRIARLLTRRGRKMVALYGATAEIHDRVTRNPGSFEETMRGFAYLREAGAGFEVQLIPMRENYHQFDDMLALGRSLSSNYRVGSPWIFLSAAGSDRRNREIAAQRLAPKAVIDLDRPAPAGELITALQADGHALAPGCALLTADDRLFAGCIAAQRSFHVDPYGRMSFCAFIKDPALRFDLRQGSFSQAWEEFIPSLAGKVRGGPEYLDNCGSCDLRRDCRWCAVYGYLEHGRFSAKVDYLCRVAEETRRFKEGWKLDRLRYYQIAGITIQVTAEFSMNDGTFGSNVEKFRVEGPGEDTVSLHLVPSVPALSDLRLGRQVYRNPPWAIYQNGPSWVYLGISNEGDDPRLHRVAVFDADHRTGTIHHPPDLAEKGNLGSLTTFASDQILLARMLADRGACYLHSSGFVLEGKGLLFVGHSEAGKSTMIKLLRGHGEILCDERVIVRRWPSGFRIHGTWSHGELPDVSSADAPLRAIMFLDKADANELIPIDDKRERLSRLLSCVIKPLATADWWEKTLDLAGKIAAEVPAYRLRFDKSGEVVGLLRGL